MLCGLWRVRATEMVAGEVQARLDVAGIESDGFHRDILDRVYGAMTALSGHLRVSARMVGKYGAATGEGDKT